MKAILAVLGPLTLVLAHAGSARAEFVVNVQGAAVFTGYNDVRIPGDTGTDVSFSAELDADTALAGRLETGYVRAGRDYFGLTVAPLRAASHGRVDRDVDFAGASFAAGTSLDGTFRFDSYRLTWRRRFALGERFDLWLGLTAKLRDAAITLEGGGQRATKTDTGFVPLINFAADRRFAPPWSLRIAGDALAAPQGRAEDVLIAFMREIGHATRLFAGYRILEGGADNDEVYTFSLFHYVVGGLETRF